RRGQGHRQDVRHRRHAGRVGRGPLRARLLRGRPLHGLRPRDQGLHRRGAWRDWQHRRCGPGRADPGDPRVGRTLAVSERDTRSFAHTIAGRRGLHHLGPGADLPARRHPGRGRPGEGVNVLDRALGRRIIKAGLLGGFVVAYLATVGMIGAFNVRNLIGDKVTLGRVLLALPVFMVGALVTRPRLRGGVLQETPPRATLIAGAGAGALAGGITIAAVYLAQAFNSDTVRGIFVAITPQLIDIMTFGRS